MQSSKPQGGYLTKYAVTNEQKELDAVIYDTRLNAITKPDAERLIKAVGKWAFYLGAKVEAEDLLALCGFLRENFPKVTIAEVEIAIKLYVRGSFDKVEYYGLNPLFMSNVMNAYLNYRRETLAEVVQRHSRDNAPETSKITAEEYHQSICLGIRQEYANFLKKSEVDDPLGLIYSYLDQAGLIDRSLLESDEARNYADSKTVREQVKTANNIGDLIRSAYNKGGERHLRNFALIRFFQSVNNIEETISQLQVQKIN
jgi:hypothetical protein